jgi:hypothetical protein
MIPAVNEAECRSVSGVGGDRAGRMVPSVFVVFAGAIFGGVDQYLGTTHVLVHTGDWAATVSNMSAPWLIVPFVAGLTQQTRRRAVTFGFVVTFAALAGYWAMTLSPMEGVPLNQVIGLVAPLLSAQRLWIAGGIFSGPLFGFLGYWSRISSTWIGPAIVAGALCLEPAAWASVGKLSGSCAAWTAEVEVGVAAAVAVTVTKGSLKQPG